MLLSSVEAEIGEPESGRAGSAGGANAQTVVGHRKQQPVALPPRRDAYFAAGDLGLDAVLDRVFDDRLQ